MAFGGYLQSNELILSFVQLNETNVRLSIRGWLYKRASSTDSKPFCYLYYHDAVDNDQAHCEGFPFPARHTFVVRFLLLEIAYTNATTSRRRTCQQ